MGTLANSEDLDEMQYNVAFHQVLYCLLRLKQPSGTEKHNLENSSCGPLKYIMGSHYVWENQVKLLLLCMGLSDT